MKRNSVDYVEIWPADAEGYVRHACETWNLPPPVEFYAAKRAGWSNLILLAILEDGSVYRMEHTPISERRGPIFNRERTEAEIDFMRRYGLLSMADGGAKGGRARTPAKAAASRANGRKGGRPRLYPCDGETLTEEEIESRLAADNYRDEYCRFEQSISPLEGLGPNCRGCPYKRRCKAWPTIKARD